MNRSLFPSATAVAPRVTHLEQLFRDQEARPAPLVAARMGAFGVDVHDPGLARAFVAFAGVAFGLGLLAALLEQ